MNLPDKFGRYQVIDLIGPGAMGLTYALRCPATMQPLLSGARVF
jgi:hypothetical protein